jgi:dUTPase
MSQSIHNPSILPRRQQGWTSGLILKKKIFFKMVFAGHEIATWKEVEVLQDSKRGAGGLGHSGKQ